jgi:type I restriction enzyme, R subunit
MKSDTSERGLERLICVALAGTVCDPVQVLPDVERETAVAVGGAGWICGDPNDCDREYTVDLGQLAIQRRLRRLEGACVSHVDSDVDQAPQQG